MAGTKDSVRHALLYAVQSTFAMYESGQPYITALLLITPRTFYLELFENILCPYVLAHGGIAPTLVLSILCLVLCFPELQASTDLIVSNCRRGAGARPNVFNSTLILYDCIVPSQRLVDDLCPFSIKAFFSSDVVEQVNFAVSCSSLWPTLLKRCTHSHWL